MSRVGRLTFALRAQELRLQRAAVGMRGASMVAATIRLPPQVNRISGVVRQLANTCAVTRMLLRKHNGSLASFRRRGGCGRREALGPHQRIAGRHKDHSGRAARVASRAGIALEGVVGELIQHCLSVLQPRIQTRGHFGALRPCRLIGVNRKWVFYGQSDTIDPLRTSLPEPPVRVTNVGKRT
jgi:hypothetical protein